MQVFYTLITRAESETKLEQGEPKQPGGVTRRQFLTFTGIGLLAGLAAMALGSKLRGRRGPSQVTNLNEDSMFKPRDASRLKS